MFFPLPCRPRIQRAQRDPLVPLHYQYFRALITEGSSSETYHKVNRRVIPAIRQFSDTGIRMVDVPRCALQIVG